MLVKPHSAIPSWYGYIYQGHIAIYWVLRKMNEQIDSYLKAKNITQIEGDFFDELFNEIQKFSIELEWMEDFSIKYEGQYLSFHQVKASDETKKLKDDAIIDVVLKLLENDRSSCNDSKCTGIFHVVDNSIDTLKVEELWDCYLKFCDKLLQEYTMLLNLSDIDLIKQLNSKKGRTKNSFKKIFYDNNKISIKNKNSDQIRTSMKFIYENLEELKYVKEDLNKIQLEIDENVFSTIEQIETDIKNQIEKFYSAFTEFKGVFSKERIENSVFPALIQHINDHVDQRKKSDNAFDIGFGRYINILKAASNSDTDISYETYKYKKKIADYLTLYIEDQCEKEFIHCNHCDELEVCNFAQFIEDLAQINNNEMTSLIANTHVLHNVKNGEFPNQITLQNTLFNFIREIKQLKLERTKVNTIFNDENYWCTSNDADYEEKKIIKYLDRNKMNILEMLFEADNLITLHTKINKIEFGQGGIIKLSDDDIKELDENYQKKYLKSANSIIMPKKIRIIDFKTAKKELNND